MDPLRRLPHFPPSPFPGYYELFARVLVPRSQDSEISNTTELGSLQGAMLARWSTLVKSPDSEDPNVDIREGPLLKRRQNRKTLQPSGNCFTPPADPQDAGYSEFASMVQSIAQGWSNFDPLVLLPQYPNR